MYCFHFGTTKVIYITFVIVYIINENMIMKYVRIRGPKIYVGP